MSQNRLFSRVLDVGVTPVIIAVQNRCAFSVLRSSKAACFIVFESEVQPAMPQSGSRKVLMALRIKVQNQLVFECFRSACYAPMPKCL